MSTHSRSDARLNFRLPNELKIVIEQAAGYLGQSVSEFAVSTLVRSDRRRGFFLAHSVPATTIVLGRDSNVLPLAEAARR